ncbi:MAG: hypothetical protein M3R15_29050 [Acidobacteriota bacterium]|nr:hypothetical protein [Acidobacteriota bacterium]
MIEPSKPRAPYIIRQIPQDQIEGGRRLQKIMESIDAESKREQAEQDRAVEAARVEESRIADIEEARRAASVSGKLMDSKYGWVNQKG